MQSAYQGAILHDAHPNLNRKIQCGIAGLIRARAPSRGRAVKGKGGVSEHPGNRLRPVDITTESTETTKGPSARGERSGKGPSESGCDRHRPAAKRRAARGAGLAQPEKLSERDDGVEVAVGGGERGEMAVVDERRPDRHAVRPSDGADLAVDQNSSKIISPVLQLQFR